MAKLDGTRVSDAGSMPNLSSFTKIRLFVGIYKIFLRAFILIAFMVAGYFRQCA
ncbi:MAG: hypothetical protein HC862_25555 [Scytonema sp. RU_4_4]|nr:hypothetical protein [Scytonema sp. RU_4_4]NJR73497.1 hypothetical protein [Scytonema sp. CRU_2_7]